MLNVMIVGAGGIAPAHIEAYKAFPGRCEVRALCDLYPDKARKLAAETGITPQLDSANGPLQGSRPD